METIAITNKEASEQKKAGNAQLDQSVNDALRAVGENEREKDKSSPISRTGWTQLPRQRRVTVKKQVRSQTLRGFERN